MRVNVRRLISILISAVFIAFLSERSLDSVLIAWLAVLIGFIAFFPRIRLSAALFLSLTLYAATAYVAHRYGRESFEPWPPLDIVITTTVSDVLCVLVSFLCVDALIGLERVDQSIKRAASLCQTAFRHANSGLIDILLSLVILSVGALDMFKVVTIGISNVLSSGRRQFATELLLGGNHNVQLICMAATVYLVCRLILARSGTMPILSLALLWTPYILVGSRKELVTVGAICFVILLGTFGRRLVVAAVAVVAVLFVYPALKSGDIYHSLHEFILPQYMHFSVAMGMVPNDLGGTFIERAQFLLPSVVRFSEIEDFGTAFYELRITGVGIGASPFAEATLNDFLGNALFSFVTVFVSILCLMVWTSRKYPTFSVVTFGLMLVYGRSDLWTFMFFAVYMSLMVSVLLRVAGGQSKIGSQRYVHPNFHLT